MIPQNPNGRPIADMHIAEFTQAHNIHLTAFKPILDFLQGVREYDSLEDVQSALKTAVYDLECLDSVMQDNQDHLWQFKEWNEQRIKLESETVNHDKK